MDGRKHSFPFFFFLGTTQRKTFCATGHYCAMGLLLHGTFAPWDYIVKRDSRATGLSRVKKQGLLASDLAVVAVGVRVFVRWVLLLVVFVDFCWI